MKKILFILAFLLSGIVVGQTNPTFNQIRLNSLKAIADSNVTVYTNLTPGYDSAFSLGNDTNRWDKGWFDTTRASVTDAINVGWVYPFPDSFSYRPPFHLLKNPNTGEYLIDPSFNLRDYVAIEGTGTTYYVNVETGSDANPGTSAGSPFKSMAFALAKTDVSTIYVAPGYYYQQYGCKGTIPTRSIEIIGTGDSVILTTDFRDVLTFTADGNLYKAYTDTTPVVLWDRLEEDPYGDPQTLKTYASKARVDSATVGAFWYNSANDTLYVRLQDFRAPDSFVSVFPSLLNIRLVGEGLKYYFKKITTYGGGITTTNSTGANGGVSVYADSIHTRGGDNVFDGNAEVLLFNSSFAKVKNADLLNYDPQNSVNPTFVEYNCTVYNTIDEGYTPGGSDQASTAHNGCRGIRLNSTYKYTNASNVADVNGCESWLINCVGDSSVTATGSNFLFGTGSVFGRAWLQDCESYNHPTSGYDVSSQSLQIVHINGLISDNYDYQTTSVAQIDSNYTFQLYDPLEFEMVRNMSRPYLMNLTTPGTTGQTIRYNGTIPVANSFLTNTGTGIGINTASPSGELHIFSNTSNVTTTIGTGTGGISTSLIFTNTLGDWNLGCQNTINSGAFILTTTSLASTSAQYTFGRNGNAAIGTTDISAAKLNIAGTLRVGTTAVSTNGTDSFAVIVGSTQVLAKVPQPLNGSATLDFPSTGANSQSDLTITVTGAADGDIVSVGVPNAATVQGSYFAWVSATNTVTVRFHNTAGGAIDPTSGTFKVKVFK